jgi:hypothetical protein
MLMTRGFLGPLEAFKTHRNLMAYSFLLFEILSVRLPVAAAFQLPSLKSYLPARTFVPAGPLVAGFFLQKIFFGEGEHLREVHCSFAPLLCCRVRVALVLVSVVHDV